MHQSGICLSVPSVFLMLIRRAVHTQCDLPKDSIRRNQHTFRPNSNNTCHRGHCQTPLSVQEINLGACKLMIPTEIIRPDLGLNSMHAGSHSGTVSTCGHFTANPRRQTAVMSDCAVLSILAATFRFYAGSL